jgi:uncharacterized protein YbjT (DUF2867 family)
MYVIVRTENAGCFAGDLDEPARFAPDGRWLRLTGARRLWYWDGAASLSQLAVHGTSKPKGCKFPVAVPGITLTEVIEIIECTDEARKSIEAVPVWSA